MTVESRPVVIVWLVLAAATCLSWWLGTDHGIGDRDVAAVLVVLVAFVKIDLIGMRFMELADAARPLRRAFRSYTVGVAIGLSALLVLL